MHLYLPFLFFVSFLAVGVSSHSPIILEQSFYNSSSSTFISGGFLSSGCFAAPVAFFNSSSPRRLETEPLFHSGRLKISFKFFSPSFSPLCLPTSAAYSSLQVSVFRDLSSFFLTELQPFSGSQAFSLLYVSPFPSPQIFSFRQVLQPSSSSDFWGLSQLSIVCDVLTCPSSSSQHVTFLNQSFDLTLPPSTTISGGTIVPPFSSHACADSSSTSVLWMSFNSSRSFTMTSLDLSRGGLLSFDFKFPPECPIPTNCDCSLDPVTPLWINEVVTNNLNLSSPLWLDYQQTPTANFLLSDFGGMPLTFADSSAPPLALLKPNYISIPLRSSLFSDGAGMGFEIAGTPGLNISGYHFVVIGTSVIPNCSAYDCNLQFDGHFKSDSDTDLLGATGNASGSFYLWKILDYTFPSIVLDADPVSSSRIGLASFSYDWAWSAACVLAGLPGNSSVDLTGHSCHIFLLNPSRTEVLHRVILGSWHLPQRLLSDWITASTGTSANPALAHPPFLPVPCIGDDLIDSDTGTMDCTRRIDNFLGGCINCRETSALFPKTAGYLIPGYTGSNAAVTPSSCYNPTNDICTGNLNCSLLNIATPGVFIGRDCSQRTSLYPIMHPSLSILPQTGSPDCFTPWWDLQDFSFARQTLPTLFSSNDFNLSLPPASSTPTHVIPASSTHNRRSSDIPFICSNLSYDTSSCCGVSSNSSYITLEGRASSSSPWLLLENLYYQPSQLVLQHSWMTHKLVIPSWLTSAAAQLRWQQYWLDSGSPILTGSQTWGLDNVIALNQYPIASPAKTALHLSLADSLLLVHSELSSSPSLTISFWMYWSSSTSLFSDFSIIESPGLYLNISSSTLKFSVSCLSTSFSTPSASPVLNQWAFYSLHVNASHLLFCLQNSCFVSSHFCSNLNSFQNLSVSSPPDFIFFEEFRLYSTYYSPSKIESSSRRLLRPTELLDPFLESLFHFDEGSCADAFSEINSDANFGLIFNNDSCSWIPSSAPLSYDLFLDRSSNQISGLIFLPSFDVESNDLSIQLLSLPLCGELFSSSDFFSLPVAISTDLLSPYLTYVTSNDLCPLVLTDSFQYSVQDQFGSLNIGTVTISLSPPPSSLLPTLPELSNQFFFYTNFSPVLLSPSSTSFELLSIPEYGYLMDGSVLLFVGNITSSGTITYHFSPLFDEGSLLTVSDSFLFRDPSSSLPSKISLIRRLPLPMPDSFTVSCSETALLSSFLQNDYYLLSDSVGITSVGSNSSSGVDFLSNLGVPLIFLGGDVFYRAPPLSGVDSFLYTATLNISSGVISSTGVVTVNISCLWNPMQPLNFSVSAGSSLSILLPPLSPPPSGHFFVTSLPTNGRIFESNSLFNSTSPFSLQLPLPWFLPSPHLLYQPNDLFSGFDFFTYSFSLDGMIPLTNYINISVLPLGQPPQTSPLYASIPINSSNVSIPLSDVTMNSGFYLNFSIDVLPTVGTLFCFDSSTFLTSNGSICSLISFSPPPSFSGSVNFTFSAINEYGKSDPSFAFLEISGTPPSASDYSISLFSGETFIFSLADFSNPSLSSIPFQYHILTLPESGTLCDIAVDESIFFCPITSLPFKLVLSSRGFVQYVSSPSFIGNITFSWVARDSLGLQSSPATIFLSISAPLTFPEVNSSLLLVSENSKLNPFSLSAHDLNTPLVFSLFPSPSSGFYFFSNGSSLSQNTTTDQSSFLYSPQLFYSGWDFLDWQASNSIGYQSPSVQQFFVLPSPNSPYLPPEFYFSLLAPRNSSAFLLVDLHPVDSDPIDVLSIYLLSLPAFGEVFLTTDGSSISGVPLSINSSLSFQFPFSLVYLSSPEAYGIDSFSIVCVDSSGLSSNTSTVYISVLPIDANPFSPSLTVYLYEGSSTLINLTAFNGTSPLFDPFFQIVLPSSFPLFNWSLSTQASRLWQTDFSSSSVLYIPPPRASYFNYSSLFDSFFYRITESSPPLGSHISSPILVHIHIINLNDQPISKNSSFVAQMNTSFLFSPSFDDPDRLTSDQSLSLVIRSLPSSGIFQEATSNTSVYLNQIFPNQDPLSPISFYFQSNSSGMFFISFEIIDIENASSFATISIRINAPPSISPFQAVGFQDESLQFLPPASDDATNSSLLTFTIISLGNISLGAQLFVICPLNQDLILLTPSILPFSFVGCQFLCSPHDNFFGSVSFSLIVTDSELSSSELSAITITFLPSFPSPILIPESSFFLMNENSNISFKPQTFSSLSADFPISYFTSSLPSHGILSPPGVGALLLPSATYIPDVDFIGFDSFTFISSQNGTNSTFSGTISFFVRPSTDPPPAQDLQLDYSKGTYLGISFASQSSVPPFTFPTLISFPQKGSFYTFVSSSFLPLTPPLPITINNFSLFYFSSADAVGFDSFDFSWCNFYTCGTPGSITLNISSFDYPIPTNLSLVVDDTSPFIINLTAFDSQPIGGALSFSLSQLPQHGTLSFVSSSPNSSSYLYSRNFSFSGNDFFLFIVQDESLLSSIGRVDLNLEASNSPPVAFSQFFPLTVSQFLTLPLLASDADLYLTPSTFSFQVLSLPLFGTLYDGANVSLSAGMIVSTMSYQAPSNLTLQTQNTSFEYLVLDTTNKASLSTGIMTFQVTGSNNPPEAFSFQASTLQDIELIIDFSSHIFDPDGQVLFVSIPQLPPSTVGALFQYNSSDLQSRTPIVAGDSLSDIQYRVWFQPAPGYSCPAVCSQFNFSVTDSSLQSQAVVLLFLQFVAPAPVLAPPLIRNLTAIQNTDIILPFSTWMSSNLTETSFVINIFPTGGTIYNFNCSTNTTSPLQGGVITGSCGLYRPQLLLSGSPADSFSWSATSNSSGTPISSTNISTVLISLSPIQFPPSCSQIRVFSFSGKYTPVSLYGYSLTDHPIYLVITKTPLLGSLYQFNASSAQFTGPRISGTRTRVSDSSGRVVYFPPQDRYGTGIDQFSYKACDLNVSIANCGAICTIKVDVSQNTPPSPLGQRVTVTEDIPQIITLKGTDPNIGDILSPIISYLPIVGKLRQVKTDGSYGPYIESENSDVTDPEGRIWYLPPANVYGIDADGFGFRMRDQIDTSLEDAAIIIDITAQPDAPQTSNITILGQSENSAFAILLGGFSPDGLPLSSYIFDLPKNGSLSQSSSARSSSDLITEPRTLITDPRGKVIYTPFQYFYGIDSFSYYVQDERGFQSSPPSVITLQILHVNNPPSASSIVLENVKPLEYTLVTFNATDPDGSTPPLLYIITSLPNAAVDLDIYQEENSQPVDKIVFPNTLLTSETNSILLRPNLGLVNFSFNYMVLDSLGGRSPNLYVLGNVSAVPPSSGGSLDIGVVAGIAAGVGFAFLLLIYLGFRYFKKRSANQHSIAGSLTQRKSSKDMLEKLLTDSGLGVVIALSEVIDITEADELALALVSLFMSNDAILPLLLEFISREVRTSTNPSTLFRSNSLASKMLKVYSRKIGIPYLQDTLSPLIAQVLNNPGAYEVNRTKLLSGQNLDTQWDTLNSTTDSFLKTIIDSLPQIPPEFRKICSHLYSEVILQFPGFHNAHTFVGGFLFLRFLCPAIVAPEVYSLCPDIPPMAARRGLILVSKALQNLSNGVQFGSKEEYMMPMNPFIVANISRIREFLLQASSPLSDSELLSISMEIDSQEKMDALDILHRHLFVHQDLVFKELAKLSVGEGINRDFLEHLASFDLLLSYPPELTEEIITALISDLPLTTAICHSIPPSDHLIPSALIDIFEFQENTLDLIRELIRDETQNSHSSNMLFRGYSPAMRISKEYVDIIGLSYLQQHLAVTIKILCKEPNGYEIDPRKLPDNDSLLQNVSRVDRVIQELLSSILSSQATLPPQIRIISKFLFDASSSSNSLSSQFRPVSDFFFGKILCPAILSPASAQIVEEPPSPEANRVLLLITKAIQAICNSKKFPAKDMFEPFNSLVVKYEEKIQEFLHFLVDSPENLIKESHSFLITSEQLDSSVRRVHQFLKMEEASIRQTLTPDAREAGNLRDRLEAILLDMGPPIQTTAHPNAQ